MIDWSDLWHSVRTDESGQGLVEYVLIIALVAIGLFAVMITFRDAIGDVFSQVATELNNAPANQY